MTSNGLSYFLGAVTQIGLNIVIRWAYEKRTEKRFMEEQARRQESLDEINRQLDRQMDAIESDTKYRIRELEDDLRSEIDCLERDTEHSVNELRDEVEKRNDGL